MFHQAFIRKFSEFSILLQYVEGILFSIICIPIKRMEMFLLIISTICFIIRWSLCNFEEFHIDDIIMKTENLRSKCYLEWKTCDEQTHPGGKFELVKMQRLIWRHNPDLIILIQFAQYPKIYIYNQILNAVAYSGFIKNVCV